MSRVGDDADAKIEEGTSDSQRRTIARRPPER